MKKTFLSILILSLLLAVLAACAAQAQQLDEPTQEPAPTVAQIKHTESEDAEDEEIGIIDEQQEDEEAKEVDEAKLFKVFKHAYNISNFSGYELGIDYEIRQLHKLADSYLTNIPDDLEERYLAWREGHIAALEGEEGAISSDVSVASFTFTDVYEAVYATGQVNIRSGPGTSYEKVGSLGLGEGVTRTGIGTGDYANWSRVEYSNGLVGYISSSYLSTTKPTQQQQQQQQQQTSNNNNGTQSNTGVSQQSQTSTPSGGGGYSCPPGSHIEVDEYGNKLMVDDATGWSRPIIEDGIQDNYEAGTGQLSSYEGNISEYNGMLGD